MKQTLRQLIILLAVPAFVHAQVPDFGSSVNLYDYFDAGDGIEGINIPYYDDDNVLRAKLYGGYARLMEDEVVEVTDIRIDVYDDEQVIMTIYAPQCFAALEDTDGKKMLRIRSDGDVLIEMEQMSVVGKGFTFTSERNKFEILSYSRVFIRESARTMEGLEL